MPSLGRSRLLCSVCLERREPTITVGLAGGFNLCAGCAVVLGREIAEFGVSTLQRAAATQPIIIPPGRGRRN